MSDIKISGLFHTWLFTNTLVMYVQRNYVQATHFQTMREIEF